MTIQLELRRPPVRVRQAWTDLSAWWGRVRQEPWVSAALRVLGWAWPVALLAYLSVQLAMLGWQEVWQALPGSPLFFLLIPLLYVVPSCGDLLVYRHLWGAGRGLTLPVILRKNVMNSAVLSLSGELYLVMWARRNLGLAHNFLLRSVTDSNIVSSLTWWLMLSCLLAALAASGLWRVPLSATDPTWTGFLLVGLAVAALMVARGFTTVLKRSQIGFAFGVHAARILACYVIQLVMWSCALPEVPLVAWLNFLALRLLLTTVAVVPNRELLWISVGVGAAGFLDLPQAGIAAMLLVMTAGEYVCHLLFVALPSLAARLRRSGAQPEQAAA